MPEKKWMSKKVYDYDIPREKGVYNGPLTQYLPPEEHVRVKRVSYEVPTVYEEATRVALEEYPTSDQKDTFKAEVAKYPKYQNFKAVDADGNKLKKSDINLISKFAEEMQVIQHDLKNRILTAVLGDAMDPKVFYEKLWQFPQHTDMRVPVVFQFEKSKTTGKEGTAHTFKWDEVADAVYKKKGIVICPAIHFYKYKKTKTLMRSVSLKSNHIMEIPALCIDVDDVFAQDLGRWLDNGWNFKSRGGDFEVFPDPNIIVNSGNGLHLYYLLDKPVSYHHNIENLEKLYSAMQYKYKTVKQDKSDYIKAGFIGNKMQSLLPLSQSFRAPGSAVKAFKKEPEHFRLVKAFEFREDKYSINELAEAFGMDNLEFVDGIDREKYPDYAPHAPYVKHLEGKPDSKAEYRVKCLVEEIPIKSVNIKKDLILFARTCKSAGIEFQDFNLYVNDILKVYYKKNGEIEDLDSLNEKMVSAYDSTPSGVFINAQYSFKESIKGSMQSSYFYSKCKEIKNHIHVGNRYWTLVAMADIANKCNISKESYLAEMEKYYLEIQDAVDGRGDDPFTRDDFSAGVSRYDKGFVKTSKKKLEEWVGFSLDGHDLPQKVYVKKESKEIYYINAMARYIDTYLNLKIDECDITEDLEILFPDKRDLLKKFEKSLLRISYTDQNTKKVEEFMQSCNESFVYKYYDLVMNYIKNNSDGRMLRLPINAFDVKIEECLVAEDGELEGLNYRYFKPLTIKDVPKKKNGKKEFHAIFSTNEGELIKIRFKKSKEEEIEDYFRNFPDHSINQATKDLGMSKHTVSKYFKKLKEEGRI